MVSQPTHLSVYFRPPACVLAYESRLPGVRARGALRAVLLSEPVHGPHHFTRIDRERGDVSEMYRDKVKGQEHQSRLRRLAVVYRRPVRRYASLVEQVARRE